MIVYYSQEHMGQMDYYHQSVKHVVDGVEFRVINDGRCLHKYFTIDPKIVSILTASPDVVIDEHFQVMQCPPAQSVYYRELASILGYEIERIDDGEYRITSMPFTLPPGFQVRDRFLIYRNGIDAIGIELHPYYASQYALSFN